MCYRVLPCATDMNGAAREKLAAPRNYRLKQNQIGALGFFSEVADNLPVQHIVRTFVDFGIKVTRMNGNQLPLLDQVRLQRAIIQRARSDAKRSRK